MWFVLMNLAGSWLPIAEAPTAGRALLVCSVRQEAAPYAAFRVDFQGRA